MPTTTAKRIPLKLRPLLSQAAGSQQDATSAIYTKWNAFLNSKLNPLSSAELPLNADDGQKIITEWEQENSTLQGSLLETILAIRDENERRQIVQMHQTLITRLMDKIYVLGQSKTFTTAELTVFQNLTLELQGTLNFMEELMGRYFERNENAPIHHNLTTQVTLASQLELLDSTLAHQQELNPQLKDLVLKTLKELFQQHSWRVTYNELKCYQELLSELLAVSSELGTEKMRELLYFMNYNEQGFVAYEFERLREMSSHLDAVKQKVGVLRLEQKKINQWPTKAGCVFSAALPSLKDQVNGWINEEVKFHESGYSGQLTASNGIEAESKIQTSLSVAKLAVIVRLLVVDKIIINRTIAPMLRIVAKLFTTLQRDDISFVSLEAKYHAPDKTTVLAVRDMLFKWIKILDKL